MKNSLSLLFFSFLCLSIFGQGEDYMTLQKTWSKLLNTDSEIEKDHYHKSIKGLVAQILLQDEGSDLSQLENFKDLWSADSSLRIVTYYFQKNRDEFEIGGEIAYKPASNGERKVNELTAISQYTLDQKYIKIERDIAYEISNWPAAWYYRIVEKKDRFGKTYYTLIGWIPKNRVSQQKIVDVLWFKEDQAYFGAPIFERKGKREYRLLYEYGAQNTMKLSYQDDHDRLVMDHLSPPGAEYHGIYEYYGPDFSFDAFLWEKDRWNYYPDIDIDEGLEKRKSDFDKQDKILEETPVYKSE